MVGAGTHPDLQSRSDAGSEGRNVRSKNWVPRAYHTDGAVEGHAVWITGQAGPTSLGVAAAERLVPSRTEHCAKIVGSAPDPLE
jgi:hypothetical protein